MMKKNKTEPNTNAASQGNSARAFFNSAREFEKSRIDDVLRSRKFAWMLAGVGVVIGVLGMSTGMTAVFFRKDPEPLVMQVDGATGVTNVLRSVKDARDKYDEVVDRFWLGRYVLMREGYDWYTISDTVEAVKLMSSDPLAREYDGFVRQPNAPLAQLKDRGKVVPKIVAVTFVGDTAQIRFTTETQSLTGDNNDGLKTAGWIATVAYKYESGYMTDQQRLVNPLGFKVLSYRKDPEVVR
jgi:type IV secretion system protein VirB8